MALPATTALGEVAAATGGTFGGKVPDLSVTRRTGRSDRKESRYQWFLAAAVLLWLLDLAGGRYRVSSGKAKPAPSARWALISLLLVVAACSGPYDDTLKALRSGDLDGALSASRETEWSAFVRGNASTKVTTTGRRYLTRFSRQ